MIDEENGSAEDFCSMLNHAPCGFVRFNEEAHITRVNETLLEMLGLETGDLNGKPMSVILNGGGRVFFQTHIFPTLKLTGSVEEIYLTLKHSDGSDIPVFLNGVRPDQNGSVGYDCIFVAMNERARYEEALLTAKKNAELAQQREAEALHDLEKAVALLEMEKAKADAALLTKDQFIAALSHELRTPLTPALMISALLEKDETISDHVRAQITMMRKNVELEVALIDDLLDITRISTGKLNLSKSVVDLHDLIEQATETIKSDGQQKEIAFEREFGAERFYVHVDPVRLLQVLWNLLKNAVKFTPQGGNITVKTRNCPNDELEISVKVSGIGMAPDVLPHVFKRFEQGDIAGQHAFGGLGLGLGLTISQAIVAAHGGEIRAESEGQGEGATFVFRLSTVDEPSTCVKDRIRTSQPTRPLKLLIIEDHETTRIVMEQSLNAQGHQVTAVGSLKEARQAYDAEEFDGIISDLGLPDGNGLELMREIRTESSIPSIALSGYGMDRDVEAIMASGFSTHLVKPIKIDQLINEIRRVILIHDTSSHKDQQG